MLQKKWFALFSVLVLGLGGAWWLGTAASPSQAAPTENVITVTTTADNINIDNLCSLREAISNVNTQSRFNPSVGECLGGSSSLPNVIVLESNATYNLTIPGAGNNEGDLDILYDVIIRVNGVAPATIVMTVANQRTIQVHPNVTAELENIHVRGAGGNQGGIDNQGTLTLDKVLIRDSAATAGGGLYNSGTAVMISSTVLANTATDLFGGGGIVNGGTLTLNNTIVRANTATSQGGGIVNQGTLTITNDSTIGSNQTDGNGGGIVNLSGGVLVMSNSVVNGNTAANHGGGIYHGASAESLTLTDVTISSNTATSENGGGLYAAQGASLTNVVFSNNSALAGSGAGIYNNTAALSLSNAHIHNNTSLTGGGIHNENGQLTIQTGQFQENEATLPGGGAIYLTGASATLTATGVNFIGNKAPLGWGGAIDSQNGTQMSLSQVNFVDNEAGPGGGAINMEMNTTADINRALFTGNEADEGGAFYVRGELTLVNTTISANKATTTGSGLYIALPDGVVNATNITVANNTPGIDLYKMGQLNLQNSIISHLGQPNCIGSVDFPTINSLGHNLSDEDGVMNCWAPTATDIINPDTLLLPLMNNGGNTLTHALQAGSPALGAGNAAVCAGALVGGVDQRGMPRAADSCDIGAFQTQPMRIFLPLIMR